MPDGLKRSSKVKGVVCEGSELVARAQRLLQVHDQPIHQFHPLRRIEPLRSRSEPGHRCDDRCPTRVGYLNGMSRSRTDKHVTQPSSFSNSEMSTRTGV